MLATRTLALVAILTAATAACSKKKPPETAPLPPSSGTPTTTRDTTGDGARRRQQEIADSIARANADANRRAGEIATLRNTITDMVFFDYDQAAIRDDARSVLDRKVPILRANPGVTLRIEGHADERGSVEYNLALSLRRATSIRDYLVGFGIEASRLEVVPMGEERPLETGTSEDAYARNRRGEFHITRGGDNLQPPR
jgi:peptidoglycan-associated lipoprotein